MKNTRNEHNVKYSSDCYLTINDDIYIQWSDFQSIKECQKENPIYEFIQRKQKAGFIRVYVKKSDIER